MTDCCLAREAHAAPNDEVSGLKSDTGALGAGFSQNLLSGHSTRSIVIWLFGRCAHRGRRPRSVDDVLAGCDTSEDVCLPSSQGVASAVTMKNCEPFVLGPAFAIARAPRAPGAG